MGEIPFGEEREAMFFMKDLAGILLSGRTMNPWINYLSKAINLLATIYLAAQRTAQTEKQIRSTATTRLIAHISRAPQLAIILFTRQ